MKSIDKINKQLVNLLGEFGGNAVCISGIDGHLIEAGLDEFPHSFIKVDGEIIAKKFRLA